MQAEQQGSRAAQTNRGRNAAAENRRALIEAARQEFAAQGAQVALSRIAKRAGVGQGSLYRHFPTRTELAVAVFEQNLEQLQATADTATPYLSLMSALEQQAAEASALVDIVAATAGEQRSTSLANRLHALVAETYGAGVRNGEISDRATADELFTACAMFARTVAVAPAEDRAGTVARVRRILDAWFLR